MKAIEVRTSFSFNSISTQVTVVISSSRWPITLSATFADRCCHAMERRITQASAHVDATRFPS